MSKLKPILESVVANLELSMNSLEHAKNIAKDIGEERYEAMIEQVHDEIGQNKRVIEDLVKVLSRKD